MSKGTILCVDDTQSNIDVLVSLLQGYDVVVSMDPFNALELLKRITVDMILLDVMMPGMDGFELCRRIKADAKYQHIPIIFLSAKDDEQSIELGYEVGGVDYVGKPFKPKELLSKVHTHLQLKNLLTGLEAEVEEAIASKRAYEHHLLQRSYMAQMGEMIDAVAHQWLQPLNVLNMRLSTLNLDYEDDRIDEAYVQTLQNRSKELIGHMTQTLNTFRNFLKSNDEVDALSIKSCIEKSISLAHESLHRANVSVDIITEEDFNVSANENELIHVFLNLFNNAKDAYIQTKISERSIQISINAHNRCVHVEDQAGGIPDDIIENMFELAVSSKKEHGGSGMGLYMSKLILDKIKASIDVKNTPAGALFTLHF
jgi:two-component system, sensor histidine kinase and response regulator